jgi:hypothetical protein
MSANFLKFYLSWSAAGQFGLGGGVEPVGDHSTSASRRRKTSSLSRKSAPQRVISSLRRCEL